MEAFHVFTLCQTQWNASMGGVTGLNYLGVTEIIGALEYNKKVLLDVQYIERGALEVIRDGR